MEIRIPGATVKYLKVLMRVRNWDFCLVTRSLVGQNVVSLTAPPARELSCVSGLQLHWELGSVPASSLQNRRFC